MRDEAPKQQLSAIGILSGLLVGQRGFTGAKDDAEGTILRAALKACFHTGRCVIADALHTTHATARYMCAHGLHYLLTVKGNRPAIQAQLRDDCRWTKVEHTESGHGHGRIERRTIQVFPELDRECPWLAFPGVRFATRLVREVIYRTTGAVGATQVAYLLTSLPPELATPQQQLRWSRLCWTIENCVHYLRDMALREDACRVRKGSLPRVMAAFANLTIPGAAPAGRAEREAGHEQFQYASEHGRGGRVVGGAAGSRAASESPRGGRGRDAPAHGNRTAEPCRISPEGTPRPHSGTPQRLWMDTSVGDGDRKTR